MKNCFNQELTTCKYCGAPYIISVCDTCSKIEATVNVNLPVVKRVLESKGYDVKKKVKRKKLL